MLLHKNKLIKKFYFSLQLKQLHKCSFKTSSKAFYFSMQKSLTHAFYFIIQNIKIMHTQDLRFNKINTLNCFIESILKQNGFFFFLV